MILLDTNVISEQMRPEPYERVLGWFKNNSTEGLALSSITEAELLRGITILPEGRLKAFKSKLLSEFLRIDFANLILPFESIAANHCAEIFASRKTLGRPISTFDCMIAAIARANDCKLATRNVSDFEHCRVEIINPWIATE